MLFREFLSACEQNPTCSQNTGIERIRCIRECISPSCYAILYKHDEVTFKNKVFLSLIINNYIDQKI